MSNLSLYERAYDLARSGRFRTVSQIANALRSERYAHVDSHLQGGGIRSELRRIMLDARRSTAAPEPHQDSPSPG